MPMPQGITGSKIIETTNQVKPWATEKSNHLTDESGSTDHQFYNFNGYNYKDNIDNIIVMHL